MKEKQVCYQRTRTTTSWKGREGGLGGMMRSVSDDGEAIGTTYVRRLRFLVGDDKIRLDQIE